MTDTGDPDLRGMRAVVTGACGFIGAHLCARLLDGGAQVIGVDAFDGPTPRWQQHQAARSLGERGARIVRGDVASPDLELTPLVADATHVFHLAGIPGVRASWGDGMAAYAAANVAGTERILTACRDLPWLERFVLASSSSVYGDAATVPTPETAPTAPLSPYGVTKLAAEHLTHAHAAATGLPAVILRYFTVYGPGQRPDMAIERFISRLRSGRPVTVFGDGQQRRDFTYVADTVEATVRAALHAPHDSTYNIGTGRAVALADVIAILQEQLGAIHLAVHRSPAAGDAPQTRADVSRAAADLGWVARVALEDGLARQVDAHVAASAMARFGD